MNAPDSGLPAATHVGRVGLVVADLDDCLAFYRDVVGLDVRSRDADAATLGAGGDPLLELRADPDAPERGRDEAGLFHTAFRVPTRAALGDALERVRERWTLTGASDHLVSEALYLSDPEGNGVEIYRDRPRDAWPVDDDGSVGMDTLPLDLADLRAAAGDGSEAGAPPGTDVGHVHLEVTDVAAARAFYVDGLGLRVRQSYGDSALFLAADDYHHHVGLNSWNERSEPAAGRGLDWFELVVTDDGVVEQVAERLADGETRVERTSDGLAATDRDGITVRLRTAAAGPGHDA